MAFSVKQAKPKTVDDAVRLTMEMESYIRPAKPSPVSVVSDDETTPDVAAAVATKSTQENSLQQILERMEKLETELKQCKQSARLQDHEHDVLVHQLAGTVGVRTHLCILQEAKEVHMT